MKKSVVSKILGYRQDNLQRDSVVGSLSMGMSDELHSISPEFLKDPTKHYARKSDEKINDLPGGIRMGMTPVNGPVF